MGVRKELDLIKKEFREGIHMPWYSHYFDFKKFSVLILRAEVVLKKVFFCFLNFCFFTFF